MSYDVIYNSLIFKGSKNKNQIIEAASNPINQELISKLDAVYDSNGKEIDKPLEEESDKSEKAKEESTTLESDKSGKPESETETKSFTPSSKPAKFTENKASSEDISDRTDDTVEHESSSSDVEEKSADTSVNSSQAINCSQVSLSQISAAMEEIPAMLNLNDETKGATYASFKGGTVNEFWIYFDTGVNINNILSKVNKLIYSSGYPYLEFNRVVRESNAVVFSIAWIYSNYSIINSL